MTAYYNENDKYAAEWLRNLISAGLIAPGDVDERSIVDVKPANLIGYTQCHFFAGIGGWSYALRLAGWSDSVPVWTGSCPCQPFSAAGKQKGFDDERHLWPVWFKLIRERRPAIVFGEQVASASAWLRLVRSDLEGVGYAVGAMPIQAASAGADHLRDRYWFVGHHDGARLQHGQESNAGQRQSRRGAGMDSTAAGDGAAIHMGDAIDAGLERHAGHGDPREGRANTARPTSAPSSELMLAYADLIGESEGRQQRSGQQRGASGDTQARHGRAVSDASGEGSFSSTYSEVHRQQKSDGSRDGELERCGGPFQWVIGADGKGRRVKPGIRLLADGVSNRVGKLRGFGNAIDPRPAAEFIGAAAESIGLIVENRDVPKHHKEDTT